MGLNRHSFLLIVVAALLADRGLAGVDPGKNVASQEQAWNWHIQNTDIDRGPAHIFAGRLHWEF